MRRASENKFFIRFREHSIGTFKVFICKCFCAFIAQPKTLRKSYKNMETSNHNLHAMSIYENVETYILCKILTNLFYVNYNVRFGYLKLNCNRGTHSF